MGLFSFVGKVLKGVSKVASFVPGIGSTISKVTGTVGNLLDHKAPMSTMSTKARLASLGNIGAGVVYMRGNAPQSSAAPLNQPQVLRASPVLPGGAIATTSGPVSRSSSPPRTYGGRSSSSKKKRRYTTKKKRTTKRSGGSTKRRKLKFGSAAYRKKYLGHR